MAGFVYISQGQLHLCGGDGGPRKIESQFGRSLRDRALQIENRHAWKSEGRGARFMSGMLWGASAPGAAAEMPIRITGVTRAGDSGDLLYSLETNEVAGVFAVDAAGVEQRLFHTADFRLRHVSASPAGDELAATIAHEGLVTNIGLLGRHGGGLTEVTEGDSVDCAARWVPGGGRKLVYQSAGVGRNAQGHPMGIGAFGLYQVDLDSGSIETLAEDEKYDFMMPLARADGSLLFVRRPRPAAAGAGHTAFSALKEAVLLPFRLSFAVFQFFNFFSMRYGGKPLVNPRGGVARGLDPLQLMVAGNLALAMAAQGGPEPDGAQSLVPDSWELMERSAAGATRTLAKGVLSFDAPPGGEIVFANGSAVFRLNANGQRERLAAGAWIEQVAAL